MRYLFKILMATAMLTLTGCGNAQTENPDGIKNIKFSAKGKPTKTLETPNGDQEVYDPTQDPEIRKLFKEIYDHFSKARRVQQLDLFRAGCESLIVPECGIETKPNKRNPICRKLDWGSPEFSKCEIDGAGLPDKIEPQTLLYTERTEPCITDLEKKPIPVARIDEIGPKSTKMPYDKYEDQLDGFFKAECRIYFK